MTWFLAVFCFALAVVFYGWSIAHGVWTWTLFMLLGLFLWCLSAHPRTP